MMRRTQAGLIATTCALVASCALTTASSVAAPPTGLSDTGARQATGKAFPEFLNHKGWSDLQDQPGTTIKKYVGDQAAVVETGGKQALLNSVLPLRSGEGANKKPIDTDLALDGGRLRPEQPLSEYSVAPTLSDGSLVHFPNSELRVRLADTRGAARGTKQGETLVYANARPDTDALIKTLPTGVQIAFSIRGPASPTTYTVEIDMRAGDQLVATSPQADEPRRGPLNGAVVIRGDKVVSSITPAVAFDADGKAVPVETEVQAGKLVYTIKPGADTKYPVLLDPYISEDQRYWFGAPPGGTLSNPVPDFNGWSFSASPALLAGAAGNGAFGNGLNIFGSSGITYPSGGSTGFWTYQAPFNPSFVSDGLRIVKADFGYTAHVRSQPFGSAMVQGIYNRNTGQAETPGGKWRGAGFNDGYTAYNAFGLLVANSEGVAGNKATYPYRVHCLSTCDAATPTGSLGTGTPGNQARFGLIQQAGRPNLAGAAFMGSSLIFMAEQAPPRLTISGVPSTPTTSPGNVTVVSNDYGAGPSKLEVYATEDADTPATLIASVSQGTPCTGAGVQQPQNGSVDSPGAPHSGDRNHRCTAPLSLTVAANDIPDGAYGLTFKSTDIIGNEVVQTRPVLIDRSEPVDLTATGAAFSDSDTPYVGASPSSAVISLSDDASGVKSIAIRDQDGSILAQNQQNCTTTECPSQPSETLSFLTSSFVEGPRQLVVSATDMLGNSTALDPQNILVDRTPPPPPTDIAAYTGLGASTGEIVWVGADDPDLTTGQPGSGNVSYEYTITRAGQTSNWVRIPDVGFNVPNTYLGEMLTVNVRSVDAVGNVGSTTSRNVIVQPYDIGSESRWMSEWDPETYQPPLVEPVGIDNPLIRAQAGPSPVLCGVNKKDAKEWDTFDRIRDTGRRKDGKPVKVTETDVEVRHQTNVTCAGFPDALRRSTVRYTACPEYESRLTGEWTRIESQCKEAKRKFVTLATPLALDTKFYCRGNFVKYRMFMKSFKITRPGAPAIQGGGVGETYAASDPVFCNSDASWRMLAGTNAGEQLGDNLNEVGPPVGEIMPDRGADERRKGWQAHHIIPQTSQDDKAIPMEAMGLNCGYLPNNARNGVWLRGYKIANPSKGWDNLLADAKGLGYRKREYHQGSALANGPFYEWTSNRLLGGCAGLADRLQKERELLIAGEWTKFKKSR